MNLIRAFLAIEIPAEIRQKLALLTGPLSRRADSAVRWVRSDNIHLTLKFYGETEKSRLDRLTAGLRDALAMQPPFQLQAGGFGAFPNLNRPRVFWCGLQPRPELDSLVKTVERVSKQNGFEPESRPFSPHLTIGRSSDRASQEAIRETADQIRRFPFDPLGVVMVDQVVLFQSRLDRGGSIYSHLADIPLAAVEPQAP